MQSRRRLPGKGHVGQLGPVVRVHRPHRAAVEQNMIEGFIERIEAERGSGTAHRESDPLRAANRMLRDIRDQRDVIVLRHDVLGKSPRSSIEGERTFAECRRHDAAEQPYADVRSHESAPFMASVGTPSIRHEAGGLRCPAVCLPLLTAATLAAFRAMPLRL